MKNTLISFSTNLNQFSKRKSLFMSFYSTLRKYHKWPALVFTLFFLLFAISGILMNHRQTIARIDINRKYLPKNYQLRNWNLASVKGVRTISDDSIIFYGGVGIWLTNSNIDNWIPLMDGIPEGSDFRKTFDLEVTPNGMLAATRFGLYWLGKGENHWVKLHLPPNDQFCTSVELIDSNIYITTRNSIYCSSCLTLQFTPIDVKTPLGAKKEISTFKLFWNIHSGEILGIPGRLIADLAALAMIFLSITGIIYFISPKLIKKYHERFRFRRLKRTTRFSYKWHLKLGAIATILLIVSGLTGIFLRPPFLLSIANGSITLNNSVTNKYYWHDKLRDIRFDPHRKRFILATSDGLYYCTDFSEPLTKFPVQPPISVMGINVLEPLDSGFYLVGSFSGLYRWDPDTGKTFNYLTGNLHSNSHGLRKPLGENVVSGYALISGLEYSFDYDKGMVALHHDKPLPPMPLTVANSFKFPLWNLAQEFHTGRIFSFMLGDFYILVVPLTGISLVLVVVSGFLMWYKRKNLN